MLGRRRHRDKEETGDAVVTHARSGGATPGGAGYSAVVWHLDCRLYLPDGRSVDFAQKIGNALHSAGDLTFAVGDTVPACYDPADPAAATIDVDAIRERHAADAERAGSIRLAQAEDTAEEGFRAGPPEPPPAVAPVFRLVVTDVIFAMGKTSVLGTVQSGTVHVGDSVTVNGDRAAVVSGIEMFLRAIEGATSGQTIALHFSSIDPTTIVTGDTISGSTAGAPHP